MGTMIRVILMQFHLMASKIEDTKVCVVCDSFPFTHGTTSTTPQLQQQTLENGENGCAENRRHSEFLG